MRAGNESLEAARRATVRICNRAGRNFGHGLLLDLGGEAQTVLTCHHVIAQISPEELCVARPAFGGDFEAPEPAQYNPAASRPESDTVVLTIARAEASEAPALLHLDPARYSDRLDVIGLTHLQPNNFSAILQPSTRLKVAALPSVLPDTPEAYDLPAVFRLANPSDARRGISGAVAWCESGIIGLAHFARGEGTETAREVYLVPLLSWVAGLPALAERLRPLIDRVLGASARVCRASELRIGTDVIIASYRDDVLLERPVLAQAREKLKQVGGATIVGRPKSGKTHLVWQLLKERPNQVVVIPRDPRPPRGFERSGLVGQDLLLFWDDLHRASQDSDPVEWRRELEDATGRNCRILCTSRDGEDWKRVRQMPRVGLLLNSLGRDAQIFTSRSDGRGEDLSRQEGIVLAQSLAMDLDDFEDRFDGTPGSLTLGLDDMCERYERLRDEARGNVSMSGLLDAAKILLKAGQPAYPLMMLRRVTEAIILAGSISGDLWNTIVRRTEEEGFGQVDPRTLEMRIYQPYLEQSVLYEPEATVFEAFLPILTEANDWRGIAQLAQTLTESDPALAERACHLAIDGGVSEAHLTLANVLRDVGGREAEAEAAYCKSLEIGIPGTNLEYGKFLIEQPGRALDAEHAYRAALSEDSEDSVVTPEVLRQLGNALALQPGKEREAEDALRGAIEQGWFFAYLDLGNLFLANPTRISETEEAWRRGIEAGLDPLMLHLGDLIVRQPGREPEAEGWYRQAIAKGFTQANLNLGRLLSSQPGRQPEAEQLLRTALSAGDPEAADLLADLLSANPEKRHEVEGLYRTAIEGGVALAYHGLGDWLAEQHRESEAEAAYSKAIEAGNRHASVALGWLLSHSPGREADAERALRTVNDAIPMANYVLWGLLANQPGREREAREALERAAAAGVESAVRTLQGDDQDGKSHES
jgi:tetratricopeptide (TPR) repeat protein